MSAPRRTRTLWAPFVILLGCTAAAAQEFEPVTDEMLADPDPPDWLH